MSSGTHPPAGGAPASGEPVAEQKLKKKGSFSNLVASLKKKGSSSDLAEAGNAPATK